MKDYARKRAGELLERLNGQVGRVSAGDPEPDAVHDLRVSIRRFSRCLRVFSQFFPKGERKQARSRLTALTDLAGSVRDKDIALELIGKAGIAPDAPAMNRLRVGRARAGGRLNAEAKRWKRRGFAARWRKRLEL